MSIYAKRRVKITLSMLLVAVGIVVGFWSLLFVTDYIMFKNNMPILFATNTVEEVDGVYVMTEKGLGYYVITGENNVSELYLFGHKVK